MTTDTDADDYTGTRRLGVLGGTFDPPHRMHLTIASAAAGELDLARVLFLPAGDPWRKADRFVSEARHRLTMTRLALQAAADPRFACSDMEIRRSGPTYTSDTLRVLRAQGHDWLWFILGSDAIADLPNWHHPAVLTQTARLAVITRPGAERDPASLDELFPGLAARVDWVPAGVDPLSGIVRRDAAADL